MSNTKSLTFLGILGGVVKNNRLLILLLIIFFVLRIPSLFEPHRYADEEIYLTLGQGVREGLVLYRDIHDNKPPFLYLIAALAGTLFWLRFILLVVHTVGVVFFWKLASYIFEKKRLAVFLSTLLFGLLSTLPFLEGNIANGENFMIIPPLIGVMLFYRALIMPNKYDRLWIYLFFGFSFAIGFLFKVPIAFDFLGMLIFWLLIAPEKIRIKEFLRMFVSLKFCLALLGFIVPVALSIVYYAARGAFEPYFRSALLQNIGYLSSWSVESENALFSNPLVWRAFVVLGIFSILFILSKRVRFASSFMVMWSAFSMYGGLLSTRPYPHYLLQPLVPFSLLLISIVFIPQFWSRVVSIGVVIIMIFFYFQIDFWYYPSFAYYKNFIEYASRQKTWDDYLEYWSAGRNYAIADYIRERTQPSERVFVWGTEPSIYAISGRLPVGRYTVAYHIIDFYAYEETMMALRDALPTYIIVIDELDKFEELGEFLKDNYYTEKIFDNALIYKRKYLTDF